MQRLATLALGVPSAVVLWFLFLAAPVSVQTYLDPPVITHIEGRDASIYLMWSAVDGATGYQYGWDFVDGLAAGGSGVVPGGGTSHTITGLENGQEYAVWVWAVGEGEGTPSDARHATPMAPTPTPALPIFGAVALGAGLLAAGRARLRRRALRPGWVQRS